MFYHVKELINPIEIDEPDLSAANALQEPAESYEIPSAPERPEEFAPGLDKELQEMADALAELKSKLTKNGSAKNGKEKTHAKKN